MAKFRALLAFISDANPGLRRLSNHNDTLWIDFAHYKLVN